MVLGPIFATVGQHIECFGHNENGVGYPLCYIVISICFIIFIMHNIFKH